MIAYRLRRFREAWREEDATTKVFLAWNAANTLVAVGLLLSAFSLLVVASAPGFQRTVLLAYIAIAICWLVSIFAIGPAYDRAVPPE